MKKLNILFVSEYYYPRRAGGEVWAQELCEGLAALGHKVTVITSQFDNSPKKQRKNGVQILRVAKTGLPSQRIKRLLTTRKIVRFVQEHLETEQVDVVHTTAYSLNVPVSKLAVQKKVRCVTSYHTYFGRFWKEITPLWPLMKWLEKRNLLRDKGMKHVPSQYLHDMIKEDLGVETTVIHNWLPEKFPKPKKTPGLLFVGSLEPVKNPLACVDTASDLNKKLYIIGSGSLRKQIEEKAKKEDVEVIFLGELSRQETLARIGGADMVLVPSITESFSLVAIEALAQGTPIEGSKVGIIKELKSFCEKPNVKEAKKIRNDFNKEKLVKKMEKTYEGRD